jgi:hypothetical protein
MQEVRYVLDKVVLGGDSNGTIEISFAVPWEASDVSKSESVMWNGGRAWESELASRLAEPESSESDKDKELWNKTKSLNVSRSDTRKNQGKAWKSSKLFSPSLLENKAIYLDPSGEQSPVQTQVYAVGRHGE